MIAIINMNDRITAIVAIIIAMLGRIRDVIIHPNVNAPMIVVTFILI